MSKSESEIFFTAEAGRVEGRYHQSSNSHAPVVLLLHSHPMYGSSLHSPIIQTLDQQFIDKNFTTLRINFRGVGRSEGSPSSKGVGEVTDASLALDWLEANNPNSNEFWVAGFAFGAWVAMQILMRRPEVNNFVVVAPPIDKYDFAFLSPCPTPGLIVHGDSDSVVSERQILDFIRKVSKHQKCKIDYRLVKNADHFFRDKLPELGQEVSDYLTEELWKAADEEANDKFKYTKAPKLLLDF